MESLLLHLPQEPWPEPPSHWFPWVHMSFIHILEDVEQWVCTALQSTEHLSAERGSDPTLLLLEEHAQSLEDPAWCFCLTESTCRQFSSFQGFFINVHAGTQRLHRANLWWPSLEALKELFAWTRPSMPVSLSNAVIWTVLYASLPVSFQEADTSVSVALPQAQTTGCLPLLCDSRGHLRKWDAERGFEERVF